MTEIEGNKPYENTGIKEGDLIINVDNVEVTTTKQLIDCIAESKGKTLQLTCLRAGEEYITKIVPTITSANEYKLRIMGKRWSSRNRYSNLL